MARTNFTTPVGRLVMGSLYKPQTTDADGKPLLIKSGPNAGQPQIKYFFALAVPKNPGETHFTQTPWGQTILKVAAEAFPQAYQSPTFAWKVVDGDSTVPNTKGIAPVSREGYKGNWVISFSSGFAPKIYNKDGTQTITEPDAVKLGYFVQVNGDVDGNGSSQRPGVYLNHSMVALSAFGEEIKVGADPTAAGFGTAPLPAGAMATPPAQFAPAPLQAAAFPAAQPGNIHPVFPAPGAVAPQFPGVVTPVAGATTFPSNPPNPAILAVPAVPGASVAPVMTAKAAGATYEQMIAAGWTLELMKQHGMIA